MSIRETADALVAECETRLLPEGIPRRVKLPDLPGKVDAVVGMRRTGKTWLLYERIHALTQRGVPRAQMLYLNFEDERLLPWTPARCTSSRRRSGAVTPSRPGGRSGTSSMRSRT